ncbi:hypothetical protein KFK09_018393 [Dendrobium nobile]|uniref:DUF4283 domain-containing protein n=1 Tax=Dendrobium nobile TaxID=94219 RepID=A0A8T3AVT9_DENNO|nr:hypothetical protein KFK09_018393 [Dendrobium nobile]
MESAPSDFPPLPSSSILGSAPAQIPSSPPKTGSYAKNLAASSTKVPLFQMSFVLPENKLSFKPEDLLDGSSLWTNSLVGYSIGQRPYYERHLSAMKKVWNLKGPWFILGKPFILQRWSPKFQPVRDESAFIPIWIKIINLPLALWTPAGISRIASYVGIPISVDTLTANRTRLTFARVCVQINKSSPLPEVIPIEIDGDDIDLKVVYDWKPSPCEGCSSLFHPFSLCSSNPNPKPSIPLTTRPRGRSSSRNKSTRIPSSSARPPLPRPSSDTTAVPPSSSLAVLPNSLPSSSEVILATSSSTPVNPPQDVSHPVIATTSSSPGGLIKSISPFPLLALLSLISISPRNVPLRLISPLSLILLHPPCLLLINSLP